MTTRKKVWFGIAVIILSGMVAIAPQVEANLGQFLGQFDRTRVEVNGQMLREEEVPPFIVNGRTVLPLRQITELLGAYVEWDEDRGVVKLTKPIVNMTVIKFNKTSVEVNPSFKAGMTHSFQVATQVSNVPTSRNLKTRFIVSDKNHTTVYTGTPFSIDTTQFNRGFNGNLDVANLRLNSVGEYILKLQMEDPESPNRYLTIGEYVLNVVN